MQGASNESGGKPMLLMQWYLDDIYIVGIRETLVEIKMPSYRIFNNNLVPEGVF